MVTSIGNKYLLILVVSSGCERIMYSTWLSGPYLFSGMPSPTEYTECWLCPLSDICSISIILLASLVAGRKPYCSASAD
jgi:hypothetical protein